MLFVRLILLVSIAAVLAVAMPFSNHSSLAFDSADEELVEMLQNAWDKKRQSKEKADAVLGELQRTGNADSEALYAYLLVKIRQSDIRKAVTAAEQLLESEPTHLRGHHAYSWLLLLTRKQRPALVALREFDKANDADKTIDETSRLSNIRAMGRMFGYLEGPQSEDVPEPAMRDAHVALLDGATEKQAAAFNEQRQFVVEKYQEIIADKEETETETLEEGKKEQKEKIAELDQKQEKLEEREDELEPHREKITAAGLQAIDRLKSQALPLEGQLSELNADAFNLQRDFNNLIFDAQNLDALALREEDPILRDRYLIRADRLRSSARSIDFTLSRVYRNIRSVAGSLELVYRELRATQAKYGMELESLDRELNNIAKLQKKTEGQANRASRPVRPGSGRSKALQNRAKGITTYEEFPVELEREKLLTRLKLR